MTNWIVRLTARKANAFYACSAIIIVAVIATLFLTFPLPPTPTPAIAHNDEPAAKATKSEPQTDIDKAREKYEQAEKAWLETDPNLEKDISAEVKYRHDAKAWTARKNLLLPVVLFFLVATLVVGKIRYDAPDPD